MAEQVQQMQRKLSNVEGLRDVVNAMRNLAAVYVRRAESTLRAMRPYADIVNTALGLVLDRPEVEQTEPRPQAPALAVTFASDQGLAGRFNDSIITETLSFLDRCDFPVRLVTVGLRGANLLQLRGVTPHLTLSAPTSLEGIRSRMPQLAADVFNAYGDTGAERMFFVFNSFQSVGRFQVRVRRIIPPVRDELVVGRDREFTYPPILTAPAGKLLGRLVEEYFFVELYRSLLESHASENGARLAAMTSAGDNIERRLKEIRQDYQRARQEAITEEMMDVVSGAEAQREDDGDQ